MAIFNSYVSLAEGNKTTILLIFGGIRRWEKCIKMPCSLALIPSKNLSCWWLYPLLFGAHMGIKWNKSNSLGRQ